jgi:hypothetical protein
MNRDAFHAALCFGADELAQGLHVLARFRPCSQVSQHSARAGCGVEGFEASPQLCELVGETVPIGVMIPSKREWSDEGPEECDEKHHDGRELNPSADYFVNAASLQMRAVIIDA